MNYFKWIQKGFFIMTAAVALNTQASVLATDLTTENKLNLILQKPLILGASVSGDYRAQSPGKRLALQYTTINQIKSITRNGSGSFKILESFKEKDIVDRSVIIAIDLFFWDSTLKNSTASLQQLKKVTDLALKHKVPLVIGEVPNLIPGWQPQREFLNKEIRARCSDKNQCYLISLDDLLKQALSDGFISRGGHKYPLAELLPDGLHLSTAGSDVIADKLKILLASKI